MKTRINNQSLATAKFDLFSLTTLGCSFIFLLFLLAFSPNLTAQGAASGKLTTPEICPADPCPCDDFFEQMSLYYFGEDNVSINVYRNNSGTILITSFANVNSGDLLVIDGTSTLNGRLGTYTYFEVITGGGEVCTTKIFSRCPSNVWPGSLDDQRVLGKTFGDFTVFAHTDSGNASECTIADVDQDWHVGGNVVAATNRKLGTRNDEDVVLISNDQERGIITRTGEFGINTQAPAAQLDVDGDAIINSTLDVNGIARMNDGAGSTSPADGALIVTGGAGISENINVGNNADVNNDLSVGNDAAIGRDLSVVNDATIGNDLQVTRDITNGRDLGVGQDATVGRNLTVTDDAAVGNNLSVVANAGIGNDLNVGGDAMISQNLSVTMDAGIGQHLTVAGQADIGTHANVGNNLNVGSNVSVGGIAVPAGYRVAVDGRIICEEVLVNLSEDWPDYVFSPDYQRPNIKEWEAFIAENHHLPGLPAAAEINAQGGFDLGETNRLLLEKIEELTLMLIDQQAQLEQLQDQLNERK